ncbi:phage holin family protein [Serratia fonticola]|uniref:phage holin family protein n=1 Tax=Serratia fonticola TaxID=47917 RepID=UPI00358F2484
MDYRITNLMQKFIELSLQWIINNHPIFWSSTISFFICFLWESNINSNIKKILSLSIISGLITLGVVSAMEYLQLPEQTEPLIGVVIGLLGPKRIKNSVDNIIRERIQRKNIK